VVDRLLHAHPQHGGLLPGAATDQT
jgi:hypothetical protein